MLMHEEEGSEYIFGFRVLGWQFIQSRGKFLLKLQRFLLPGKRKRKNEKLGTESEVGAHLGLSSSSVDT